LRIKSNDVGCHHERLLRCDEIPVTGLLNLRTPFVENSPAGTFAALRLDWRANTHDTKSLIVLTLYRFANLVSRQKKTHPLLYYLGAPVLIVYKIIVPWILCVDIPSSATIGPGLRLFHGQALVINPAAVIGRNCTLRHATTIGCKILPDGRGVPSPVIMDNVDIGSNAVIIGDLVIGESAIIGAGAVVTKSVPARAVVAGNPARIVRIN
jgi:putative colanic acid biosynthesis acetyltransferase WcaB